MGDRVLVTGGAGFIGSHLVDRLLADGHHVVVLDDFSTGLERNLAHVANDIEIVVGDIRDAGLCGRVAEGARWVFHQAALGSVPRSIDDPVTTHEVNITGILNMLMAARDGGAERFVFAASSAAYGDTPVLPKVETMPVHPMSPYAASKVAGECYCSVFSAVYGLPTVSLRYFNVFGPRQRPDGPYAAVIPIFIDRTHNGQEVVIFGDGGQTRDFTYVSNAVQANLLAATAPESAWGKVINVATGQRVSVNQLYTEIAKHTGCTLPAIHTEQRIGDVRDSLADVSRAEDLLGFTPGVLLEDGLRETVEWFVSQ